MNAKNVWLRVKRWLRYHVLHRYPVTDREGHYDIDGQSLGPRGVIIAGGRKEQSPAKSKRHA